MREQRAAFEQERELTQRELHHRRPRLRPERGEAALLQPLVARLGMQMVPLLQRVLCALRIRSIHSADVSSFAWPSGTIGMGNACCCGATMEPSAQFPRSGRTLLRLIRRSSWAGSARSSGSRTWWNSLGW